MLPQQSAPSILQSVTARLHHDQPTCSTSPSAMGCPGIGTDSCTPRAFAPGKIRSSAAAAAAALGLPPARQSSKLKRDWRTCGLCSTGQGSRLMRSRQVRSLLQASLVVQVPTACRPVLSTPGDPPQADCYSARPPPYRVAVRHTRVVHQSDVAHAPPQQRASHGAAQRAGTQQQAACRCGEVAVGGRNSTALGHS